MYVVSVVDGRNCVIRWGIILQGETDITLRKACSSTDILSTSLTRNELELNPGLLCDRPAINQLSHGASADV
jgi:hypothetical protein